MTYFPEPGYGQAEPEQQAAPEVEAPIIPSLSRDAPNAPRFCRDCRHHQVEQYGGHFHDACTRPYGPRVDLVTGEPVTTRPTLSCRAQRQAASLANIADAMKAGGLCGPFGHYWQPREACPDPVEAGVPE